MMTRHYPFPMTRSAAALLASGARLERRDSDPVELLTRSFESLEAAVKAGGAKAEEKQKAFEKQLSDLLNTVGGHREAIHDLSQRMHEGPRGSGSSLSASWGQSVVSNPAFKDFVTNGCRGTVRTLVQKAITSVTGSAGDMIGADRKPVVPLAQRRLTIRDVVSPGRTSSNVVEFARVTGRTNNARVVSETTQKPESNLTMEPVQAPVRTIAHFIMVSRQAMDDADGLRSLIDSEMRFGLDLAEEAELLNGDGTGQHLDGLIPNATAFDTGLLHAGDTAIDYVLRAKTQAELADLPATFVVLNTEDWASIVSIKDNEGRYLIPGGPLSTGPQRLWNLDVVPTNSMDQGDFLVGSGMAAQIFDRLDTEVLVSSEDRDNFVKNMLTVRAEKRLAFAVKRPEALITGTLPLIT